MWARRTRRAAHLIASAARACRAELVMPSYWSLLSQVLPVFALIALGVGAKRLRWLTAEAEGGLLKLTINALIPALILENVLGNAALRRPDTILWAVALGFGLKAGGLALALAVARTCGAGDARQRRTFAFATAINNYGYMAIPVTGALFAKETVGVLLVFNVGVEVAIWTVGLLMLNRTPLRQSARQLLNGPVCALALAVPLNFAGGATLLPPWAAATLHMIAACALPLGLMIVGATLADYLGAPRRLWDARWVPLSWGLRLGVLPALILGLAATLPLPPELRQVLIVQAAMPSGVLLIVIAKHHGGDPLVAVQVALGTTLLGLVTVPLWLRLGLGWLQ
jgi:malate permease and related proteins